MDLNVLNSEFWISSFEHLPNVHCTISDRKSSSFFVSTWMTIRHKCQPFCGPKSPNEVISWGRVEMQVRNRSRWEELNDGNHQPVYKTLPNDGDFPITMTGILLVSASSYSSRPSNHNTRSFETMQQSKTVFDSSVTTHDFNNHVPLQVKSINMPLLYLPLAPTQHLSHWY